MLELTDQELWHLEGVLYDEVYYGDDDVVYGFSEKALALRSAYEKIREEAKKRKLW